MAITLKDKILKIDLKLQLKYKIGGKEFIHYPDLTEYLEPELFEKITEAVADSMNKQWAGIEFNHEPKAKLDIPHVINSVCKTSGCDNLVYLFGYCKKCVSKGVF